MKVLSRKKLFIPVLMLLATGCAAAGTSTYSLMPPSPTEVENEIIVDKPFQETWDQLVKGLAKSFFVINNVEKVSRIINVSFSVESPEEFIDCGMSKRIYDRGNDHEEYMYSVAASSSYRMADKTGPYRQFPVTHYVNRATSLDGRVNIYVAPEARNTRVAVNSRYIFSVRITGNSIVGNVFGTPVNNVPITPQSFTHSFNTNQPNSANWGTPQAPQYATCYSTGKLEGDILRLVR